MNREAQRFELQEERKRYLCGRKEAWWKKIAKVPTQYKKGALVPISSFLLSCNWSNAAKRKQNVKS